METRVTYRASQETVKRLQELSDKYGISQSALLTMLVNERWLVEHATSSQGRNSVSGSLPGRDALPPRETVAVPEPPPNFPEHVQMGKKHKHRKRH